MKKNEGLLKRLKNIEDKTDKQLEENKDNQLGVKSLVIQLKKNYRKKHKTHLKNLIIKKSLLTIENLILKEVTMLVMILVITDP